jgi:hypothetical protein
MQIRLTTSAVRRAGELLKMFNSPGVMRSRVMIARVVGASTEPAPHCRGMHCCGNALELSEPRRRPNTS